MLFLVHMYANQNNILICSQKSLYIQLMKGIETDKMYIKCVNICI